MSAALIMPYKFPAWVLDLVFLGTSLWGDATKVPGFSVQFDYVHAQRVVAAVFAFNPRPVKRGFVAKIFQNAYNFVNVLLWQSSFDFKRVQQCVFRHTGQLFNGGNGEYLAAGFIKEALNPLNLAIQLFCFKYYWHNKLFVYKCTHDLLRVQVYTNKSLLKFTFPQLAGKTGARNTTPDWVKKC